MPIISRTRLESDTVMSEVREENLQDSSEAVQISCQSIAADCSEAIPRNRLVWAGASAFALSYLLWPLLVGLLAHFKLLEPGLLIAAGPLAGMVYLLLMVRHIANGSWVQAGKLLDLAPVNGKMLYWMLPLAVIAAIITAAVTLGWGMLLSSWNLEPEMPGTVEVITCGGTWQVAIFCCSALLAAPLFEEVLFRKLFFEFFAGAVGKIAAAGVTALIFAAMHLSLLQMPGLMMLALLWQRCFLRSRNLTVPVLLHFFNNVLAAALLLTARYVGW